MTKAAFNFASGLATSLKSLSAGLGTKTGVSELGHGVTSHLIGNAKSSLNKLEMLEKQFLDQALPQGARSRLERDIVLQKKFMEAERKVRVDRINRKVDVLANILGAGAGATVAAEPLISKMMKAKAVAEASQKANRIALGTLGAGVGLGSGAILYNLIKNRQSTEI